MKDFIVLYHIFFHFASFIYKHFLHTDSDSGFTTTGVTQIRIKKGIKIMDINLIEIFWQRRQGAKVTADLALKQHARYLALQKKGKSEDEWSKIPQKKQEEFIDVEFTKLSSELKMLEDGVIDSENGIIEYKDEKVRTNTSHLVIPDGVTVINHSAFAGYSQIETVTIPDSVIVIGKRAFAGCINLKKINFSNNLVYIGEGAFNRCYSLENIILPESTSYLGKEAFQNCSSLKMFDAFSTELKYIEERTFENCRELEFVSFPCNGLDEIKAEAFQRCSKLRANQILVKKIRKNAFSECASLRNISLPDTTVIGVRSFDYCTNLTSINLVKVKRIRESTFCDDKKLERIFISPDCIIEVGAFKGCENLKTISSLF